MNAIIKKLRTYFIPHEENDFKPHFFATTSVFFFSILILFTFIFSLLQYAAIKSGNNMLASVISSTLVDITNENRIENGKGTLVMNPILARAAQAKADDMATKSYFAHTSPEGVTPWHWFDQAGYVFSYAGENLAVNFSDSVDVSKEWMNSPGHRANILNEHFTEIGIATSQGVYNGEPTTFVVQLFGKPGVVESGSAVVKKETMQVAGAKTVAPQTALATTSATSTLVQEVAGASIETVSVNDMFIAVKNTSATGTTAQNTIQVPQSSWLARLLVSPKTLLAYAYVAFGLLVVLALTLDTFIEMRRRHPIHLIYAMVLWFFIFGILFLGGEYVFPAVLVG